MSRNNEIRYRLVSFSGDIDPYQILKKAGLKSGQTVLEVGCGSGFFTVPAAELVGENGSIYAIDLNPEAVESVRQRIEEKSLKNVKVINVDASETGLPEKSFDLALLFGVIHALHDLDAVLREICRLLKKNGSLSVYKTWWSEKELLDAITWANMFYLLEKTNGIFRFACA